VKTKISRAMERELDALGKDHKVLNPSTVVDFAKNKRTALHKHFIWDDTEAANRYRLNQASWLLRFHVTVLAGTDTPVRCFVSLKSDRGGEDGSYRLMSRVMSNTEYRAQLLEDARQDMLIFRNKYKMLAELAKVFDAMDSV
jgi:hypothetical protein